ncbi:hypothetical protein SISSUDRAFT_62066 [Sistotremastrum suecicum HHB10207 ss-3]|uniref:Uncharacterized protein n=1 Tax=Sistotremastrum suecicum HHB10207 ss-3 TaxID=1314776 RepID=A0A166BJW0_9AGAM|nr:hypothetical protein SISSUDRAFT_62066 [Sistotremastrum suecicum HHB10207 ss-3]
MSVLQLRSVDDPLQSTSHRLLRNESVLHINDDAFFVHPSCAFLRIPNKVRWIFHAGFWFNISSGIRPELVSPFIEPSFPPLRRRCI